MNYSQILPNLFVGSFPKTADDVGELKTAGVTGVLNLQTQEDFDFHQVDWPGLRAKYFAHGIDFRRIDWTGKHVDDDMTRLRCPRIIDLDTLDNLFGNSESGELGCFHLVFPWARMTITHLEHENTRGSPWQPFAVDDRDGHENLDYQASPYARAEADCM